MSAGINADSAYDGHAVVGKDRARVASKEGSLSYVRPLGRRDRQSPWKPYLFPNPHHHHLSPHPLYPNLSEQATGRGEVRALKMERRWQLSHQSWWDKVIFLSCCNWWTLGWSKFAFFRGGLNQQGFGPYPKLYFSSQYVSEICLLTGHFYTHESYEQQSWFALSGHKNRNATVYPNEMQHGSGNTYVLSQLCFLDFSFLYKGSFSCGEISKSIRTLWHSVGNNFMFYK